MTPSIYLLPALFTVCLAASCWRDTPCIGPSAAAFPGPWESNIYAPSSRRVAPKSILSLPNGNFISAYSGNATLGSNVTGLVFDFGVEVGGIITVNYTHTGASTTLGLAFTESKLWIGRNSDNSNGGAKADGALVTSISARSGSYVMPLANLRGGFRYLTLFLPTNSTGSTLRIDNVSLEIGFQPTWSDLRAYQGYFHSSDDLLNKVWYSGAYTLQTNAVPPKTGRHAITSNGGWVNDAYCGTGTTVLLDGAKRDRWVWTGDMGIASRSSFASTGDMESVKNALQVIYDSQAADGGFPKAGPPYLAFGSDTYHMWTMIGTYNYFLYTNDTGFIELNWSKYLKAMAFINAKVGANGILVANGEGDWGRWKYAKDGSAPNMLLYESLKSGSALASLFPRLAGTNLTVDYLDKAKNLKAAIMEYQWDESRGAFKDSPTNTTLYPQDANSMALAFGVLTPNSDNAKRVSDYLASNWTPIGPICPELPKNVSPFIASIEIEGHFQAGRPDRAIELIRSSWGWYLNNPNGTQSTVIEGFLLDGTFGYRGDRGYRNDPSYISHAHGWSSGPTSALTEYFVGMSVKKPAGQQWQLKPASFDILPEAEAGFSTPLGKFQAKWTVANGKATVSWDTPEGTRGYIALPGTTPRWVDGGKQNMTITIE